MRGERGQSTVDYLAVVLLVAVVFAAVVGVLVTTGLGAQITAAMERALCVVVGGPCSEAEEAARRPCVVASERRSDGGAVTISVVRIGERNAVLRERRADGTIALTLVDSDSAGLDLGSGFRVGATWGPLSFATGREMRAAVLAQSSEAKTWIVPDDRAAERTITLIRLAHGPFGDRLRVRPPEPSVTYHDSGGEVSLDLGGRVALSSRFAYGERREAGRRTVYLRDEVSGAARVSFASGAAEREERFGVTFDRDGRPVDLVVLSALDVEGGVDLPPEMAAIAGWLRIPTSGARHVETEQHLDLTDPLNADAAGLFLRGLGDTRTGMKVAAAALRERLERAGTLSVRTYATERDERGLVVRAKGVIAGGGIEAGEERESARLVAAVARRADGSWGEDPACAASA